MLAAPCLKTHRERSAAVRGHSRSTANPRSMFIAPAWHSGRSCHASCAKCRSFFEPCLATRGLPHSGHAQPQEAPLGTSPTKRIGASGPRPANSLITRGMCQRDGIRGRSPTATQGNLSVELATALDKPCFERGRPVARSLLRSSSTRSAPEAVGVEDERMNTPL